MSFRLKLSYYAAFESEYSLVLLLVRRQLAGVVGQVGALAAGPLVVHLEHVRGQALGAGGLVVAKAADEGLQMRVHVSLEAPVIHAGPRAVATVETLLALLLAGLHEVAGLHQGALGVGGGPRAAQPHVREIVGDRE